MKLVGREMGRAQIQHSGQKDKHIHGVALMISKEKVNTLMEWELISELLLRASSTLNTQNSQ